MAKRGRKPGNASNSKGRPRTRSQIKPSTESKKPAAKSTNKSNNKNVKALEANLIKTPLDNKKTKGKREKVKNDTKKEKVKESKNRVQKATKSLAPKRGRQPKNSKSKEEKAEQPMTKAIEIDNDDTENEETIDEVPQGSQKNNLFEAHMHTENVIAHNEPEILPERFDHSSTTANYSFETSLEKLQHETMAPKPFNINNQETYLPPLYSTISSSTSAFSVPVQPKHYQGLNSPENISNMMNSMTPSSMAPVNLPHQPLITPTHQTLLSPPQNAQSSSDPVHDLPPELLQQGWRKFWSRREGRPYYFNKVSNESIWEMPKSTGQFDPLTDPLGIQSQSANPNFQPPPTPTDPGTPPLYPIFNPSIGPFVQKSADPVSNEKKAFVGPFDFDIESNCYIWEGFFFYFFHAHPETELLRCNFVNKLRQQYYELCHTREGIEAPKDSFTRWTLERKVIDKGCDPFLPSECAPELSKTLYNEIMNDIPIKFVKPKFSGEARKQLSKYAEAAKKIIDSPHVSAMSRKIVKWNVEDAFEWIRKTLNATYEDYIERLEHLKKQCQPHIIEAARSSVEAICLKIYTVSIDYAKRVRELNLELFRKEELRERGLTRYPNQKKVICYPAYLINPCAKLPAVQMFTEKDSIMLRYKNGEFLRINSSYLQKLEMLYYFNCRDDRKYTFFLTRVWCMLKRYQTFVTKSEGLFSQNALPLSVFGVLHKHFGVTFECFSSPLNCYYRQYCSLFPDTDGYFGSRGPILNFYPMSGSFQANPPDCEELIEATIIHFEKLLENSIEPLSFILFIQEVPETTQKIIPKLESNKFKRTHLTINYLEHEYRHGFQYICNKNEVYVKSQYNTLVYFLQNDAGFLKWGPTPERVDSLLESLEIGRDKELLILTPPPTPANNQKPETEVRPNGQDTKDLTSLT